LAVDRPFELDFGFLAEVKIQSPELPFIPVPPKASTKPAVLLPFRELNESSPVQS